MEDLGPADRSDELGQFARAFNGLVARLRAALQTHRQFMADASHELRTPVSVVRTAAEVTLSRDHRNEGEYREALAIVGDQSRRLGRLVEDMLVLARADAGGRPLRPVDLYLEEMVADCRRAVEVLATERGVTIESGASPEIPFRGDEDLLRQLVVNVLQNAVQHTPPGGAVTVDALPGRRGRQHSCPRYRHRDSGRGSGADFRSLRSARSRPPRPRRRPRAADCAMDCRGPRRDARAGIQRSQREHVLRDAAGVRHALNKVPYTWRRTKVRATGTRPSRAGATFPKTLVAQDFKSCASSPALPEHGGVGRTSYTTERRSRTQWSRTFPNTAVAQDFSLARMLRPTRIATWSSGRPASPGVPGRGSQLPRLPAGTAARR